MLRISPKRFTALPSPFLTVVVAACLGVWVLAQEKSPEEPQLPLLNGPLMPDAAAAVAPPTNSELEAKGAGKDLLATIADLEVRQAVMAKELEKTKTEVSTLQEENDRLKLQMQALGVAALTGDERSLQLRLLNAVSDYRLADKSRQALTERLVQLCDAVTALQHSSDVSSRRRLDEALAEANGVLKGKAPAEENSPTPVEQARVVSFKRELGLAVIDCGKASGLRLGMPLAFVRKDRTIAQGVIVDCRDQLCGVLITSTPVTKDGVTLGDAIKLETTQKQQ